MDEFVNQLLQDQGVPTDLDPEIRQELSNELLERAGDFVNQRLIEAMSDDAVAQFEALLDEEPVDPLKIQDYVAANVPNKENIASGALLEFRALYLGDKA